MMDKEIVSYMHLQFFKSCSYLDKLRIYSYTSNTIVLGIIQITQEIPTSVLSDSLNF